MINLHVHQFVYVFKSLDKKFEVPTHESDDHCPVSVSIEPWEVEYGDKM